MIQSEKPIACFSNNKPGSDCFIVKSTMIILTTVVLFLAVNVASCMKEKNDTCVRCMSVAFRLDLQDAEDSEPIANARIIAINTTNHDTIVIDSLYSARYGSLDSAGHMGSLENIC
jgi:hypothetical protein